MTQPRPLGTTAKIVLESVEAALAANNDSFFGAVESLSGDPTRAVLLLSQAASRNVMALRALTLLRADRLRDAENVIIDARLGQREKTA